MCRDLMRLVLLATLALGGCILGPQEEPPIAPEGDTNRDEGSGGAEGEGENDEVAAGAENLPDDGDWDAFGDDGADGDADDNPPGPEFGAESWQDQLLPGTVTVPRPGLDDAAPRPEPPGAASDSDEDEAGTDGQDGQGSDDLESS